MAAAIVIQQPPRLTCSHFAVYTVGETHVLVRSSFRFLMENTARKSVQVRVPDTLRVVSCTGEAGEALHDWTLLEGSTAGAHGSRTLQATFEYERSERTLLEVVGEVELPRAAASADGGERASDGGAPTPKVTLPILTSVDTNRELGHIALEASQNIEVMEGKTSAISPLDPTELPPEIQKLSRTPLLAYRYLDPRTAALEISVRKHADTEVLVTAIDEVHYETTVSQEGKVLTRCLLKVRNTQRQFLRARLPAGAQPWSTLVAGVPIKPGKDEGSGEYMLALQKSGASRRDKEFVVELLYLTEMADTAMKRRGKLHLGFPSFDIPINQLFVTVRLPHDYQYGEFTGSMREVKCFTRYPEVQPLVADQYEDGMEYEAQMASGLRARLRMRGSTAPSHGRRGHQWSGVPMPPPPIQREHSFERPVGQRALSFSRSRPELSRSSSPILQMEMEAAHKEMQKEMEAAANDRAGGDEVVGAGAGAKKAGVTPVRVALPIVGKPFFFEKLLHTSDELQLHVSYKERSKSCFRRRSLWC